jgi:hypothetical protein
VDSPAGTFDDLTFEQIATLRGVVERDSVSTLEAEASYRQAVLDHEQGRALSGDLDPSPVTYWYAICLVLAHDSKRDRAAA